MPDGHEPHHDKRNKSDFEKDLMLFIGIVVVLLIMYLFGSGVIWYVNAFAKMVEEGGGG